MWTHLENWVVQDGEVPELHTGAMLHDHAERFSPDFFAPPVGTRVTVVCRLEVMADYETDDSGYPEMRHDWVVRRLKLQHRARVPVPGHAMVGRIGTVRHVNTIERMHRWADEQGDPVTYLLDLQPPSRSPGPE